MLGLCRWMGRWRDIEISNFKIEKGGTVWRTSFFVCKLPKYSGLNLNQDKATKLQTVQIVRQGEATPYWFKFNPL